MVRAVPAVTGKEPLIASHEAIVGGLSAAVGPVDATPETLGQWEFSASTDPSVSGQASVRGGRVYLSVWIPRIWSEERSLWDAAVTGSLAPGSGRLSLDPRNRQIVLTDDLSVADSCGLARRVESAIRGLVLEATRWMSGANGSLSESAGEPEGWRTCARLLLEEEGFRVGAPDDQRLTLPVETEGQEGTLSLRAKGPLGLEATTTIAAFGQLSSLSRDAIAAYVLLSVNALSRAGLVLWESPNPKVTVRSTLGWPLIIEELEDALHDSIVAHDRFAQELRALTMEFCAQEYLTTQRMLP